jgi:hypothetical protein
MEELIASQRCPLPFLTEGNGSQNWHKPAWTGTIFCLSNSADCGSAIPQLLGALRIYRWSLHHAYPYNGWSVRTIAMILDLHQDCVWKTTWLIHRRPPKKEWTFQLKMLPSHTNQLINWVFQYFKQTGSSFEMVENHRLCINSIVYWVYWFTTSSKSSDAEFSGDKLTQTPHKNRGSRMPRGNTARKGRRV